MHNGVICLSVIKQKVILFCIRLKVSSYCNLLARAGITPVYMICVARYQDNPPGRLPALIIRFSLQILQVFLAQKTRLFPNEKN